MYQDLGIISAYGFPMRLTISHLRFPLPISAYDPPEHSDGEAVWVRMPAADPKSLGIVPGMEGDVELDDGRLIHVRMGRRWTSHQAGGTIRIEVDSLGVVEST